ncbi:MAG: hypothetical protein NTY46_03745 [Candidatus Sumerlaeota bacterium]|nr:hypothetical protein [Candidatus Sumerlaeota bacterium]
MDIMTASAATTPPRSASQPDIQSWLDSVCSANGLDAALTGLFDWELKAGYFPQGIFDRNLLFEYPDTESPVTFRAQINHTRLGYKAPAEPDGVLADRLMAYSLTGKTACSCPLCAEHIGSPAKPFLRAYTFSLGAQDTPYFIQLTPFPLRRFHHILIQTEHAPMRSGGRCVDELLDFVTRAPRFTACSNSDVRDAGVSILGHHHYQVFRDFHLPVFDAAPSQHLAHEMSGGRIELLDYPLTTLRVRGTRSFVSDAGNKVIARWKTLSPGRNACNLTVRVIGDEHESHIFFRNPACLTPPDLLRIKSEAVGIVEAAGEGIYPPPPEHDKERFLEEIQINGLAILKRILSGLNPVPPSLRPEFFHDLRAVLNDAHRSAE